ncbi:MAG: hypothetical protein O2779_02230 [Nanoarchaeota archaeon]|nr:hypothetical protein [Nanoarchaeota archaeon]
MAKGKILQKPFSRKNRIQLLVIDKAVSILVLALVGLSAPDLVVIASFFLAIPYLLITKRKMLLNHLGIAAVVALGWMLIAKKQYGYNQVFLVVAGINLFPLFSFAIGLFLVYLIYSHYEHLFREKGYVKMLLLFSAFYIPLLLGVETLAYHVFNIRNLSTAVYAGIPLCDCIHAPPWMQISYLLLGPLYFSICYVLKLENLHN